MTFDVTPEWTRAVVSRMREVDAEVYNEFDDTLPSPPGHGHGEDDNSTRLEVAPREYLSVRGVSGSEWGARWPNCAASQNIRAAGGGVAVNIHRELAMLTAGLLAATVNVHGYRLHQDQTGAFVCRPIGGTRSPSNHSISTATDVNWRENEFSYNPRYTIPKSVVDMWTRFGWSWGGYWSGMKDTMHFEWMRSIAEARRQTANFYNVAPMDPFTAEDGIILREISGLLR